jgi:hypothetical protein
VKARRKKDLNKSAIKGKVYALGVNERYTTSTAARQPRGDGGDKVEGEDTRTKDTELIPDEIGYVTTVGETYPIPPEQRTDE